MGKKRRDSREKQVKLAVADAKKREEYVTKRKERGAAKRLREEQMSVEEADQFKEKPLSFTAGTTTSDTSNAAKEQVRVASSISAAHDIDDDDGSGGRSRKVRRV